MNFRLLKFSQYFQSILSCLEAVMPDKKRISGVENAPNALFPMLPSRLLFRANNWLKFFMNIKFGAEFLWLGYDSNFHIIVVLLPMYYKIIIKISRTKIAIRTNSKRILQYIFITPITLT